MKKLEAGVLVQKCHSFSYFNKLFGLLLSAVLVISCDSNNNLPILNVDSTDRLTGSQLEKLQKKQQPPKSPHTFYFGFDLRASPQEDAAQYVPFLNYLDKATGYHFQLHFTPKGQSLVDELGQNKVQFGSMGAISILLMQTRYGAKSLVRGINKQGKAAYQSVFIVLPDSAIRHIKDFKGRKLAFGSRDSTQGHLIPRIMLKTNGLSLTSLAKYTYTGSHQNCAEAVISRRFDICGLQDQMADKLAAQGRVKIIQRSRYYPSSGIVANTTVPEEVITRVKQALLNFDPQGKNSQGLYHWDQTEMPGGFVDSHAGDYDSLRKWALQFGFLQQKKDQGWRQ